MLRRNFVKKLTGLTAGLSLSSIADASIAASVKEGFEIMNQLPLEDAMKREDLWDRIRQAYFTIPSSINFNNGAVSPQPKLVQEAFTRFTQFANEAPSAFMTRHLKLGKENIRRGLAELAGCSPEQVAVLRNTTEAINNVLYGIDWKAGDEVVLTKQDYSSVIIAWKQLAQRYGIVLKWIDLDLPNESKSDMVEAFKNAFTPKTKMVNITHMINWTGQILPVRKICDIARSKGILTLVDGAHTFAQLDFKIPDLNCDYFATSLHKWLCAPFGTGLLYIRKEKIAALWPSMPSDAPLSNNIRKFEGLGTHSVPAEIAISQALDFHWSIGSALKEKRLRYLKNYWCKEAIKLDRVRLHTSLKPDFSCAIAHFSVDGLDAGLLDKQLSSNHRIHGVRIKCEQIDGVRITPHVYTSMRDLNILLEAIHKVAK